MIYEPPLPMPYLVGAGAALAVFAAACYWRDRGRAGAGQRLFLTACRCAAVAGLTWVLLRPMRPEQQPAEEQKPIFTVLVDTSGSMNTTDVDGRSRWRTVADRLRADRAAVFGELEKNYEVQVREFAEEAQAVAIEPLLARERVEGRRTDLTAALWGAASGPAPRRRAGAWLISDGRDNAGTGVDAAATGLRALKIPVWTTAIGAATQTRDVSVTARLSQNFLFVRQPAAVRVDVSQSGYDNWYAKLNLYREGRYVTSQQVILKAGTTPVDFPIREPLKGVYQYAVEAEPLAGEADKDNNRRAVFARVVDEKPKVLLVEAEPYWDTKFLQRALRSDPNLELTSIFLLSPKKVFTVRDKTSSETLQKEITGDAPAAGAVGLPRTPEELSQYDCVILGHGMDRVWPASEMALLRNYVLDRGGSLVFARGRAHAADNPDLAVLEPVVWEDVRLPEARFELTAEGRLNPIFTFGRPQPADVILRELPAMISVTRVQKEKSLAVILARGRATEPSEPMAIVAYQRYGKGKVMSLGTAGLWRWAFLPEELKEHDDIYRLFWGQMIRWLIDETDFLPGQDIAFRTDRYTYALGEKIRLVIRTKNTDPAAYRPVIELAGPGGKTTTLTPGRDAETPALWVAYHTPAAEGEYRALLRNNIGQPREDVARFTVYSDAIENRFVAVDRDVMAMIARTTGGEELALENARELPGKVRCFERASQERVKPRDAWDRAAIFWALVGALALEWFCRRRWGLA